VHSAPHLALHAVLKLGLGGLWILDWKSVDEQESRLLPHRGVGDRERPPEDWLVHAVQHLVDVLILFLGVKGPEDATQGGGERGGRGVNAVNREVLSREGSPGQFPRSIGGEGGRDKERKG